MSVNRIGLNPRGDAIRRTIQDRAPQQGRSFGEILDKSVGGLRFSSHASTRMRSRKIDLSPEMMGKLEEAVTAAERKGSRDALVLLKNNAFIVNVRNKTVVTAMDGESIRENVFTNIDSAVIAD